jgi:hypothetical protein
MQRRGGEQRQIHHSIPGLAQIFDTIGAEVAKRIVGREEIVRRVWELAQ